MSQSPVVPPSPVQIVGDKTNGFVLYDPVGHMVYTFDPKSNAFGPYSPLPQLGNGDAPSADAPAADAPAADPVCIAGNAKSGVVYCSGKKVFYLTDIGNPKAQWKTLGEDAPFNIVGICGDLVNGVVIHNGDKLAQIKDVFNNPAWISTAVSPRIPIKGIAGDGTNGIVVYRDLSASLVRFDGDDNKFVPSVYKFTGQPYIASTAMQEPQIQIELLVGDGANGYVAFGENQLFSLDPAKGAWTKISSLNFGLTGAAGNPKDGLTAVLGTENFVVATDFKQWTMVQAVPVRAAVDPVLVRVPTPTPASVSKVAPDDAAGTPTTQAKPGSADSTPAVSGAASAAAVAKAGAKVPSARVATLDTAIAADVATAD